MSSEEPQSPRRLEKAPDNAPTVLLRPVFRAKSRYEELYRLYRIYSGKYPNYRQERQLLRNERRTSLSMQGGSSSEDRKSLVCRVLRQTKDRQLNPQLQSRFFRLPLEVRLNIYKYILCEGEFTHVTRANRIAYCRPLGEQWTKEWIGRSRADLSHFSEDVLDLALKHMNCIYLPPLKSDWCSKVRRVEGVLPFLQSCRRVYMEAINILYAENVFVMETEAFARVAKPIPKRHFRNICSLVLTFRACNNSYIFGNCWGSCMEVLREMTNLKRCLVQYFLYWDWKEPSYSRLAIQKLIQDLRSLPTKDFFAVQWVFHHSNGKYDCIMSLSTTMIKDLSEDDLWQDWLPKLELELAQADQDYQMNAPRIVCEMF